MSFILEKRIKVGDSLYLSPMGCGTWAWGNRFLWGYTPQMDGELQRVFNLLVSQGVTWFDTGDSYGTGKFNGRSETLLGKFSREYKGDHQDEIVIATKLAPYPWRLTPESLIKAYHQSAARVGRSIELVQLHWSPANYFPWQEKPLLEGLARLYHKGEVKAIGLSNYGPKNLLRAYNYLLDRGVRISTLQIQYSLLSTYPFVKLGLKELCQQLDIKIIAYSPLALGLLTGKYWDENSLPSGARGALFRQLVPAVKPLLYTLREIAEKNGKTMAQVAINWCICKGTIPIPGAKTVQQAKENLGAIGWRLSPAEVTELETVALSLNKQMIQNIFQTA